MRTVDVDFLIDVNGHAGPTFFAINNAFLDERGLEDLFDKTPNPNLIEGTLKDVLTPDDKLIVLVKSTGIAFRSWFVTLKFNGKDLTTKPIEFRIKANARFDGSSDPIKLPFA
jgi:hypothetical protein